MIGVWWIFGMKAWTVGKTTNYTNCANFVKMQYAVWEDLDNLYNAEKYPVGLQFSGKFPIYVGQVNIASISWQCCSLPACELSERCSGLLSERFAEMQSEITCKLKTSQKKTYCQVLITVVG